MPHVYPFDSPTTAVSASRIRRSLSPVVVLQACALVLALTASLGVLYLVKSALGIDLMAGPSPLHGLLYPLLGRG